MFAATPSLRDRLDLRKVALIALIAGAAVALEGAFLAGMVASPLGGAIADLDRIPQVEGVPAQAVAGADVAGPTDLAGIAQLRSARPPTALGARHRALPQDCVVRAADAD